MPSTTQKHVVLYAFAEWGHERPLLNLGARLVKMRPITVTVLTTNAFLEQAKAEFLRNFESNDEEAAKRVRITSIGEVDILKNIDGVEEFSAAWKNLFENGKAVCAMTGVRYTDLPKPSAVIIDWFNYGALMSLKAVSGDAVKVYSWQPGLVYTMLYYFAPLSLGGYGNIPLIAQEEVRRSGRSFEEVMKELAAGPRGQLVRIPGMPSMYDYEQHPQNFPFGEEVAIKLLSKVPEFMQTADGSILFTPDSYEHEAVAAWKAWFAELGKPAYVCGPLMPTASKAIAAKLETKFSSDSAEIQAFLDGTLSESGEKSLLYISFGSMFWPALTPEQMWAFLDVVMEMNIPFILSHASPLAVITDEVRGKVKAYGKGLLSPWTPQQLILDHPATGWFVSHGGHNSVTEAIMAGVPQIVWPFGGDQPLNAVHMTDNLGISYELLEVRTGLGLKPIYRTGYTPVGTIDAIKEEARSVLQKAFGEDGAQKREKLLTIQKSVAAEWDDGGAAKKDMTAFLDAL